MLLIRKQKVQSEASKKTMKVTGVTNNGKALKGVIKLPGHTKLARWEFQ